jgi:prepilin-type N-terminal cleavage/methylation domain-containing protein/prepilin-type processing-associated H-X9-DG protein
MTRRQRRAFTLLELVIVIGILAMATVLLVRTVSKVRRDAGDVGCQNNLRQLLGALQMYNTDHNGLMPYGIYYVGSGPKTWAPPSGSFDDFISWASELNRYFATTGYAPAFQCPAAQQQVGPHPISYVMNFIVAVSPYYEVAIGANPPNAQVKPPSVHLMLREGTALIWDTAIRADMVKEEGYLVGADVDSQTFWLGALYPQRRYFDPADPYGSAPNPALQRFGLNSPIVFPSPWKNIDPPGPSGYPFQGNLRFRHNNQSECNVAYSDGSVRRFSATLNPDLSMSSHTARRRNFMIDWPPGVTRNPSVP